MNYEQRQRLLAQCKPDMKDRLLAKLAKGETVDITKDEDLFFQINRDRMPIEAQMDRDKYKPMAQQVKNMKEALSDKNGKTEGGTMRYVGEIPSDLYFTHPWFSPTLSKKERDANVQKFFRMFPAFRASDKL